MDPARAEVHDTSTEGHQSDGRVSVRGVLIYLLRLHWRIAVHPFYLSIHMWWSLSVCSSRTCLDLSSIHGWLTIILLLGYAVPESVIWRSHCMLLRRMTGLLRHIGLLAW